MGCVAVLKLGKDGKHGSIRVSLEDYFHVSQLDRTVSWKGRYASISNFYGKNKALQFHRWIMERVLGRSLLPSEVVDHIDNDPKNNVRSNLRVCLQSQNVLNRSVNKVKIVPYKGVSTCHKTGKFRARIAHKGVSILLGSFTTAEDARDAYTDASKRLHGSFGHYSRSNQSVTPPQETVKP